MGSVLSVLPHPADCSLQLFSLLPLLPIPSTHPLVHLFQIRTLNALHQPSDNELGLCDRLLGPDNFPRSLWIMSLRANVLYHLHGKPFSLSSLDVHRWKVPFKIFPPQSSSLKKF